jgi:hypothetical protein
MNSLFQGRNLIIATKHNKELVMAPILEKELGVNCILLPDLDTDLLGTFTGEIDRQDDPITTARKKCWLAMEQSGCDLCIASEGSFGPHPTIFFASADDEFLLLLDKKNNREFMVRELSVDTNFNGQLIHTEQELSHFLELVKFPKHGIILRKSKDDYSHILKGICDIKTAQDHFIFLIKNFGQAYIETDMRALYNPSRMRVIESATHKLVNKINSLCPECQSPGFSIVGSKDGLPCELCNYPTNSLLSYIYTCQNCSFTKEEKYPSKKFFEDPMFCDRCNP